MNPIEIKRKLDAGEPINRALLAAQADAQARQIQNGYAVLEGVSMDVIQGKLTLDGEPIKWGACPEKGCFILACMLDSMKVSNKVLDEWLIDMGLHQQINQEKATKYIIVTFYQHEKAKD